MEKQITLTFLLKEPLKPEDQQMIESQGIIHPADTLGSFITPINALKPTKLTLRSKVFRHQVNFQVKNAAEEIQHHLGIYNLACSLQKCVISYTVADKHLTVIITPAPEIRSLFTQMDEKLKKLSS